MRGQTLWRQRALMALPTKYTIYANALGGRSRAFKSTHGRRLADDTNNYKVRFHWSTQ